MAINKPKFPNCKDFNCLHSGGDLCKCYHAGMNVGFEQGKKELVEEVWEVYVRLMDESITDSQVLLNLETWLKSQIKNGEQK